MIISKGSRSTGGPSAAERQCSADGGQESPTHALDMFDRLPPLQTLRAFEAVGRWLGMTRAADGLHLTHRAISRHIATLEAGLG